MHVDFGVEWTLIVNDILNIRDVQPPSCHISTDHNNALLIRWQVLVSQIDGLAFNPLHASPEPIQALESLSLLHLAVQALVLNLQEIEDVADTFGARDTVAEDDH